MARLAAAALVALLTVACGGRDVVRPAPPTYTVRAGDTLYSIATRHGLDYRDVARWNRIGRDYRIDVGQVLRLRPPAGGTATANAAPPRPSAPPPGLAAPPAWQWPLASRGSVERVQQPAGGVGIRIAGRAGDPVRAAAAGRVVYTGSGLRAYGQLVIIKHDGTWLTAYGHNASLSVREGDSVAAGDTIARLGAQDNGRVALYFEIRANGKPLDPLAQLPR